MVYTRMLLWLFGNVLCWSIASYAQDRVILERFQQTLPEDMALVMYANVGQSHIIQLLVTHDGLKGYELAAAPFIRTMFAEYGPDIRAAIAEEALRDDRFAAMVKYYCFLLQQSDFPQTSRIFGQQLYTFLLGTIQEHLQGKTALLIIPDGVLHVLPFEALVNEKGEYLAEDYIIHYVQSLKVLELLKQRRYNQPRKPMLAFGGAMYDTADSQANMASESGGRQGHLVRGMQENSSPENLPGTLHEVQKIAEIVNGADILTGADVHENMVKMLSEKGILAEYRVLHFAMYGKTDTIDPERSALILSPDHGEDGELCAEEIRQLQLNTDLVVLAASNTASGKLYSGEGVVGLVHAFFLAGANSVLASLWQADDEAAAQYMISFHTLREQQGFTSAAALAEVKRQFIHADLGESWQPPAYWAPFVLYGE